LFVELDAWLQQTWRRLYAFGARAHNRDEAPADPFTAQIDIKKASHSGWIRA